MGETTAPQVADYVVVGAGSAGCVVASRLSENPDNRVVLLEAGKRDRSPLFHMPAGYLRLMQTGEADWGYHSEPNSNLNNRSSFVPRGKVLGGSSSVNGMVFIRGSKSDFDNWAELGNRGWSYAEVLPFFKKAEGWEFGEDEHHGGDGPWRTSRVKQLHPLSVAWLEAGKQAGFPQNTDFNGPTQLGFGKMDSNIADGRRYSSAVAYLGPARNRNNLEIVTGALVGRVVTEGRRAVGVEYTMKHTTRRITARKEVILCGGTINSPQILQLSGIGDPAHITKLGIEIVTPLPGVGQNLQDHLASAIQYECTQPNLTLEKYLRPWPMTKAIIQYAVSRTGPIAHPGWEVLGYVKTDHKLPEADLMVIMLPALYSDHGRNVDKRQGFQISFHATRPHSRGTVLIKSTNPSEPPAIQLNAFAERADLELLIKGLRLARMLVAQSAFDPYRGEELAPGPQCETDEEIEEYLRATADTVYHPVGTCKMGSDPMAVVDEELRVHGIGGLRVVDASVMPTLVAANTNAATVMIGEKGADLISSET
ncbi:MULTISPECIES: choline dehydrogenase [unclassified Mesorhizobium]|uniref:GMC family oxidoreductase n=1 Tax=unclassified Mesorhizobium TaxID=325217 RepID=UPI000FD7DFAA|nr:MULTISPECIES: choline dehydrogenase [unclassified Mesorhizobium]TGR23003.1 choline dehydrogenase [Mesorhizobium sp. M8A.F.Ca.ET.197.01.1.1]TGR39088.1 choline dehydrogenase [bacterium M00.F.Ca.ET.199.01.1.1]TGR46682.1 choline dehydrogenase [Mesorhizobium sp. M8A.F.Ca.ET.198.01.1.1]TGV85244.1 choline dehydrogenase [Mesorhizobium sp. M00.F.Ca.ET.149.01.1.1]